MLSAKQSAQADSAAGLSGASPRYDTSDLITAAVDYANAHGGFAGRKLQIVDYDESLTTDQNTVQQAACADWTQDHHVFAMIAGPDELDQCAEKAHAVPIGSATTQQMRRFPHMVNPDGITLDRLAGVTVAGLARAGYFTGKLGLVTWDDPAYRESITSGYLPQLARHGIKPLQVAYVTVPQQMGALGESTASVSGAIAKFKSLGIDHVIVQDGPAGVYGGTGLTLEWMNAADSQHYYPRYGQNFDNSPGWNVLPADQMDKAIAIDNQDYDPMFDVGWHTNTARAKCWKIMAAAGYPQSSSNPNDESDANMACDLVFFLQRGINQSSLLSADAFIQAVATFGTSFQSANIYGTKLFAGRRDGADMFRTEEYFASCKCLKYQSAPYYTN